MTAAEGIERLESSWLKSWLVDRPAASLRLGLKRMGQLQADLVLIRAAWSKIAPIK